MTVEEAGQLLLEADPWEKCAHCNYWDPPRPGMASETRCKECLDSGAQLKAEYREAYQVLNRPEPLRFRTERLANGQLYVAGPAVRVGKFPGPRGDQ